MWYRTRSDYRNKALSNTLVRGAGWLRNLNTTSPQRVDSQTAHLIRERFQPVLHNVLSRYRHPTLIYTKSFDTLYGDAFLRKYFSPQDILRILRRAVSLAQQRHDLNSDSISQILDTIMSSVDYAASRASLPSDEQPGHTPSFAPQEHGQPANTSSLQSARAAS